MGRKTDPAHDLAALQSDARAVAEQLEGLHHRFRLHHLASRVTEHRARSGERVPLADLTETARTVRCYAGFLELVISAVKRSKGFGPGTTLYTDRVILHNFFSKLKMENPVKEVPRLPRFRKKPMAYPDCDLKKFFAACDDWERTFFALALSSGLRRGELKTLHWSDQAVLHSTPQSGRCCFAISTSCQQ